MELDHVALQISDAKTSLAFYRDVLGLRLADALAGDDWNGHPWLMMIFETGDGRQVALTALRGQRATVEPTDIVHYAFGVASLEPWRGRLRAAAIDFTEEDHGTQQSLYFKDPTGHTLEITVRPRTPAHTEAAAIVAQWLGS
jgi:catechol 2,3-dioxygenase-like lactoylglutathione lyase family enzyme